MQFNKYGKYIYDDGDLQILLNTIQQNLQAYREYAVSKDKSNMGWGDVASKVIECSYNIVVRSFKETLNYGKPKLYLDDEEKNFIL